METQLHQWKNLDELEVLPSLCDVPVRTVTDHSLLFSQGLEYRDKMTIVCATLQDYTRYRLHELEVLIPVEGKVLTAKELKALKRLEELRPWHMSAYNLGDSGEMELLILQLHKSVFNEKYKSNGNKRTGGK